MYHYNPETMIFDQTLIVSELPEQLPANTTTVSPDNVVQPAKWDSAAQQWTGQSLTDWHAQYDQAEQPQPTAEQQALTALAQQIADNDNNTQTYLQSLAQSVTALATGTTKNGGNA